MDISRIPSSDTLLVSLNKPALTVAPEHKAVDVSLTPAQNSPAIEVIIRQESVTAPVYTEPLVIFNRLRDETHTGVAARATSQLMLQSLNQSEGGKAPFSVATIFSQVSSLSKETTEYRNEARQFKMPQKLMVEKFEPDMNTRTGIGAEAVNLNVQTKDGDTIQIQISRIRYKDGSFGLEFSFVVDGNLSADEQKALGQLSEKLAQTSDTFFRTGTTELRGLQEIDSSVISGFNLTLRRPLGDSFEEHGYDYRTDDIAQTQTLTAEDANGYKVDITSKLNGLSSSKNDDIQVLQQYIDLIRRAGDQSNMPSGSQRFILDAFSGFFSAALLSSADEGGAHKAADEKMLLAFDSGLPDFVAKFRSPVVHNRNNYSQASAMVLTIEQHTRMEKNQDNLLIKQESRYELINNRFAPLPGLERPDLVGGNYLYITQKFTATTNRILSMTGDRADNLWIEQDVSDKKEVSRFENYTLVDKQPSAYEDRKVENFVDVLGKYNKNKQQLAVEYLLASSKERVFLGV